MASDIRVGWSLARRRGVIALAVVAALALPRPVRAQSGTTSLGSELSYVTFNAVIGGLTAGIASHARGRGFGHGFRRGFLGGGINYFGKRVSGQGFDGAGLLGREVAAVGASIVRSAAFGSGILDTLVAPLGPVRLYLVPGDVARSTFRVDLDETIGLVYALSVDRLDFDAGASLSAGAFVFRGSTGVYHEDDSSTGRTSPGLITSRDGAPDVLAHERTHVIQFDYLKIVQALPTEGWLRRPLNLGWGSALDHVDFGIAQYPVVWMVSGGWFDYSDRILEKEAEHIEAYRAGG